MVYQLPTSGLSYGRKQPKILMIKFAFDVPLAAFLLVVLSPAVAACMVLVQTTQQGPANVFAVRIGITGFAPLKGIGMSGPTRFAAVDQLNVAKMSLREDLRITAATVSGSRSVGHRYETNGAPKRSYV